MEKKPGGGTTGGPPPAYADKLNEWNDKELQKQQITVEQQTLQDEIAADMNLKSGEQVTLTYLNIGYVVTGITRYTETGDVPSCMIVVKPVDIVIS